MSDSSFFAFDPDELPEGHPLRVMLTQRERAHDHLQMSIEYKRAQVRAFFSELSIEHLVTFNMLMRDLTPMVGTPPDHAQSMISYLQGKASAVLEHVHGVCGACGKDHAAEDLAALEEADKQHPDEEPSE